MKKLYFLIITLFLFTSTKAQIINIPDANFKAKLLSTNTTSDIVAFDVNGNILIMDANNDGEIDANEALQADSMQLYSSNITSVEGLSYFSNLKSLSLYNNQITTLDVSNLTHLESFSCSKNKITSLNVSNMINLQHLDCTENQLTNLNMNGLTHIKKLFCQQNQLSSLDLIGFSELIELNCSDNQIKNLITSPLSNLQQMYCSGNHISTLNLSGFTNLFTLDCKNNELSSLDVNESVNLGYLFCLNNNLSAINVHGLTHMLQLWCENNQLQSLDVSGLISLNDLRCSDNHLSNINLSGGLNLWSLTCNNNKLTYINVNQLSGLTFFSCKNNLLTTLDVSIHTQMIVCSNNQLTSLFIKNGSDEGNGLDFDGNPNLQYICVDDFQIDIIQRMITQYGYTNCFVNTYCTFIPGGTFHTLQGNTKYDSNGNGCDATDINFQDMKFSVLGNGATGEFISNTLGNYMLPVTYGNHTITPIFENPNYFMASPPNVSVDFITTTSPFNQDFCITANGIHHDLDVVMIPIEQVQPGFTSTFKILFKNKGTSMQSGNIKLLFDEPTIDLISANPNVESQNSGSLLWNFTNLMPFERREILVVLRLNSQTETPPVNVGYILDLNAIVDANADETPNDNNFNLRFSVLSSFDPNDKICLEGNTITPEMVGKEVHYQIRFENTGTANAVNIVVKDMIDMTKFDISSLIPIGGSHPFVTKISNTNQVEFIFENINLPFDDATNDGYVAFKIKTLPSLVVGNSFSNSASIYFDYNFPIVTNTATTSVLQNLGTQDFEFSSYISVYPNPAKQVLNIDVKKQIELTSISIFNTLGQQILVIPNAQKTTQVDVSSLKTGNYFIKVTSDKGSANSRFIKN